MAVLVVTLAAAAAVATSAAGSAPVCRAAQLRGHLLNSSGAAGTILSSVTLTNRGPTCTLTGYTRLQLMAGARRPLPTHVVHGGLAILSQRPRTVVLRHGGNATVLIAYGDVPTGHEQRCPTATEILLRVPADRTWIGVLARTTACNHGTLRESPVLAGHQRAP
jgi:hypothetical protein